MLVYCMLILLCYMSGVSLQGMLHTGKPYRPKNATENWSLLRFDKEWAIALYYLSSQADLTAIRLSTFPVH